MRQTGENNSAGKLHARRRARSWKIPEDERLALRTVESVRAAKRMRINAQPRLERFPFAWALSFIAPDPKNSPPERALEIADGCHCHRINKLLMKLRITFVGIEPVSADDARIVQVDWLVKRAARRIVVDHFEIVADRTRLKRFPWRAENNFVDLRGVELLRQDWIERVAAQFSPLLRVVRRARGTVAAYAGRGHLEATAQCESSRRACHANSSVL